MCHKTKRLQLFMSIILSPNDCVKFPIICYALRKIIQYLKHLKKMLLKQKMKLKTGILKMISHKPRSASNWIVPIFVKTNTGPNYSNIT